MITTREKALLHIYVAASLMSRPTYLAILRTQAGVDSSAAPGMNHAGFRRCMASIEKRLWAAVDSGEISAKALPRQIGRRGYWASQVPSDRKLVGKGKLALIWRLIDDCGPVLTGTGLERDTYISAAIAQAIGRPEPDPARLTDREAGAVIEALRAIITRKESP